MLASAAAGAVAQNGDGIERIESLREALAAAPVWVAEYEQEFIPVGMTIGDRARGTLWLAWPDRALFHTGDPVDQMMGLNGRTVRLIDVGDKTCDEKVLTDREWERIPLAAVLDPRGALQHFEVVETGDRGVELRPRAPGGVDRVEIELGTDMLPAQVAVVDPQGAVNRLRFGRWRRAGQPPEGRWLPEPPDDIACVVEPGPLD